MGSGGGRRFNHGGKKGEVEVGWKGEGKCGSDNEQEGLDKWKGMGVG